MDLENTVSPDAETQNPAPVDETPEVVTPEPDEQQPEQKQPEEDQAAKSQRAMERRIQRLTAARYQEQARAQQALEQAQQLQARLAQYEAPQEQQQQGVDPVRLASELRVIEKTTERSNAVAHEGQQRFPDFMKAVAAVSSEAGPLTDQYGRPSPMLKAVLASKDPAGLLHHLGTNPDLASEVAGLGSHTERVWKLAEIAFEIGGPKEPKKSMAPKPIAPVKAAARDDGGLSDNIPIEEWARRFQKARRG